MTSLAVTGCGILCSVGIGLDALAGVLARDCEANPGPDVGDLYTDALPSPTGHALVDLNFRQLLGRKGTAFLDRRSGLALIACGRALEDSGLRVDDGNRHRIGVTLGTTWGSLKSMSDYTKESLLEERPYLVNPALFPNTVMNCAAGQAAIWYGLKGPNATIAGGQLAFLSVLVYAANALRCGYADIILAGAVEEFTPHTAWATHQTQPDKSPLTAGEGAAIFVVERSDGAKSADRHLDAEVMSVVTGFSPGGEQSGGMSSALADCIRRALAKANVKPDGVSFVATCETGDEDQDRIEAGAVTAVFGSADVERVLVKKILGECNAATGGLQLATLLVLHRDDPSRDGHISLITGWTRDGGIGAAVLRGWSRVSSHHG